MALKTYSGRSSPAASARRSSFVTPVMRRALVRPARLAPRISDFKKSPAIRMRRLSGNVPEKSFASAKSKIARSGFPSVIRRIRNPSSDRISARKRRNRQKTQSETIEHCFRKSQRSKLLRESALYTGSERSGQRHRQRRARPRFQTRRQFSL